MPAQPGDKPIGVYDKRRADRELARPVFEPPLTTRIADAGRSLVEGTRNAAHSFADTFRKTPPFAPSRPAERKPVTRSTRSRR